MMFAKKGTHLDFHKRFKIAMFTFLNGCPTEMIDAWLDKRQLLSIRGAVNHMSSLWRDLKSKRWALNFNKRNYHFWDLREQRYCRLDGSAWIPKGAVGDLAKAYGEILKEEPPIELRHLLPSLQLMEVNCTEMMEHQQEEIEEEPQIFGDVDELQQLNPYQVESIM